MPGRVGHGEAPAGDAGIRYNLNPYLVRGLDYYTRTVFEFYPTGSAGQRDTVVAGGRYDGLAAALGWDATPGVRFAWRLDRVTELMASEGGRSSRARRRGGRAAGWRPGR